MNILFVSIAWPKSGERNLFSDLMDEFVLNGHHVYVLGIDEFAPETDCRQEKGIHVLRVSSSKIRKVNKFKKAFSLFSLGKRMETTLFQFWPEVKIDLIIGHSPPVTLAGLFKSLRKKYQAPFYYLLKDIWPAGPADLKIIWRYGPVYYFFRYFEMKVYKTADFIGCMSQMNVDYVLSNNRFLSRNKVEVCPNTITPREISLNGDKAQIRKKFNIPEEAVVFIFSGNIGKAHGMPFYINAIERLKDVNQAYFLIGGSGLWFNYAVREIQRRGLKNIGTYARLPFDEFDQLLLACDVGVVLLDGNYTVPQFPSRLLAYLEAQKPVLCSVNKATDIGFIVENAHCGLTTLNGDYDAFARAVNFFCDPEKEEQIRKMGSNSRELLLSSYTSAIAYSRIMGHFQH